MNAKEIIKKHKGEVVDGYMLINNWGYTVTYGGAKYDVRRWANCYGSDCGWGVMCCDGHPGDKEWKALLSKDLNDIEINTEW